MTNVTISIRVKVSVMVRRVLGLTLMVAAYRELSRTIRFLRRGRAHLSFSVEVNFYFCQIERNLMF